MTNDKHETDKLTGKPIIAPRDFGHIKFVITENPDPNDTMRYQAVAWSPPEDDGDGFTITMRGAILARDLATLDAQLPEIAEKYRTLTKEEFDAYAEELNARRRELFKTKGTKQTGE